MNTNSKAFNGTKMINAVLIDSMKADDGRTVEVVEAQDGRFYLKVSGMQVGGSYGSSEPAIAKAQGFAFFGERI